MLHGGYLIHDLEIFVQHFQIPFSGFVFVLHVDLIVRYAYLKHFRHVFNHFWVFERFVCLVEYEYVEQVGILVAVGDYQTATVEKTKPQVFELVGVVEPVA